MKSKKKLTSFQIIISGFVGVILLGACILMLPISSRNRIVTPFPDALFTATSSVCVTGLVVKDTGTYWSSFGQTIIMLLIQIGGLGVVTVAASFALLSGRKISLMQRSTMQEAISAHKVGGIVKLTGFIVKSTFLFEAAGAFAMMPVFCRDHGVKGVWMAVFHSVSAFCNAGFDILGKHDQRFPSLTAYADNPVITVTIMCLIIIGGIGFLTWEDLFTQKYHWKKYRMQTKVILMITACLIIVPSVYFFCIELSDFPLKERILGSLFQAVTPRTAGFNTIDLTKISSAGCTLIIILMLIGGAPGSTAGGMKITTFSVLVANLFASFRRKEDAELFGRRIDGSIVSHASSVMLMYIILFLSGAFVISVAEHLPFGICCFETASAVGTVGLTLGITPGLCGISKTILICLMFLGRVGGLTLIYAALSGKQKMISKLPKERITVG